MIEPLFLEVAVLVTGIFLLIYESFADDREKNFVAGLGIAGLTVVFIGSFFAIQSPAVTGLGWHQFYTADPLALFFKRIALLTTIVVLIISLEYRDVVRQVHLRRAFGRGDRRILHAAGVHLRGAHVDGVGG